MKITIENAGAQTGFLILYHQGNWAIEAQGRGLWNADEEKLEKLRELYESTEDELEGVTV